VLKWFNKINERKAVQKGLSLFADLRKPLTDDKARALLFGQTGKA
jgi:GST-like protein